MSRLATLLIALAVIAGCSIQPDAAPSDLPADRADVFGDPVTGDVAAGANRIYLLAPTDPEAPQRLRSVQRDVASTPQAVLESLFAGPNAAERNEQLDTAIPAEVQLLTTPSQVGQLLTVDLNDVFDELTPDGLRLAAAQIVSTATDIEGVAAVQLRVDGETRVWPVGSGELVDRALTQYDYPGLVESTQPAFPAIPSPIA
jgi:spore germination protein GerM